MPDETSQVVWSQREGTAESSRFSFPSAVKRRVWCGVLEEPRGASSTRKHFLQSSRVARQLVSKARALRPPPTAPSASPGTPAAGGGLCAGRPRGGR